MTERVTAIANYEAIDDNQINLAVGDFIEVLNKDDDTDGWWYGRNLLGKKVGWFPANCVQKKVRKVSVKSDEDKKEQQRPVKPVNPPNVPEVKKEGIDKCFQLSCLLLQLFLL